jgi:hypothetical protein
MVRDAQDVRLRRLYDAKALAEEDAADAVLGAAPEVRRSGDVLGRVLLVKGEPGEADLAAGEALAGADGEAARSALDALGVDTASILAIVSRPVRGATPVLAAARVARYVEAADPELVVALDDVAQDDLQRAFGLKVLPFGEPLTLRGRVLLAVDGLETSLADEARKKRVWAQFRALKTQRRRHEGASE